jgi:hypothetical protein
VRRVPAQCFSVLAWLTRFPSPRSDSGVRYQSQLFVSTFEKILTLRPDVKITIVWVPSHNGILGNELADRTAVSGTVTTVLARRAGKLPSPGDANESALPVVLSRRLVADEDSVELPTDDTLVFSEGSICVARNVEMVFPPLRHSPCR